MPTEGLGGDNPVQAGIYNISRANRRDNRYGGYKSSTAKDFEGSTPKIGGILALRSKNMTKK